MKKIFFCFLLLSLSTYLYSQRGNSTTDAIRTAARMTRNMSTKSHINQNGSITNEELSNKLFQQNKIIPIESNGAIMSAINSDDNYTYLHTEAYDKNIKNIWQNDNKIDLKYNYIGEQSDTAFHYALFNRFYPKNKLTLFKTSVKNGFQQKIFSTLPEGIKMFTFRIVDEDCFIACKYKERPVVIVFHVKDSTFKVLPNLLNKNAHFLSLNADSESFTAILKEHKTGNLLIKKYSKEGYQLSNFVIPNEKRQFNEAKTIRIGENLVILGTYTKGLSYKVSGLYAAILNDDFSPEKVVYKEFSEFENLYDSNKKMPPYAIVHQLKLINNDVLCVFDFFDTNIANQEYNGTVKYEYSMICRLDNQANFVWSSVIALDGLTSFVFTNRTRTQTNKRMDVLDSNVEPAMQFLVNKNRIMGACQFGNVIYTNLLDTNTGEVVAKGIYEEIGDEQITGFLPWYGENFLVWGKERKNYFAQPSLYMRKMKIVEQSN